MSLWTKTIGQRRAAQIESPYGEKPRRSVRIEFKPSRNTVMTTVEPTEMRQPPIVVAGLACFGAWAETTS
jgi:hypothetical protein